MAQIAFLPSKEESISNHFENDFNAKYDCCHNVNDPKYFRFIAARIIKWRFQGQGDCLEDNEEHDDSIEPYAFHESIDGDSEAVLVAKAEKRVVLR